MDLEKIEGLVKIIENSSLTEFTLKEGDMKITMKGGRPRKKRTDSMYS